MDNEFVVLDLFSGAGGLSEGFLRCGFKFAAHLEMDKDASSTLETRISYHSLNLNKMDDSYLAYLSGDISKTDLLNQSHYFDAQISAGIINKEISSSNKDSITEEISKKLRTFYVSNVDVLIGGPPCQAYSSVGRSRDPNRMEHDTRNYLYKYYLNMLKYFNPDVFVFENVLGIQTAKNGLIYKHILKEFRDSGYNLQEFILNSEDFFILQKRKRVIVIGWKSDYEVKSPEFNRIHHDYSVSSVLVDLPPLNPGQGNENPQDYLADPTEYLIKSKMRNSKDILIQHRARNHNERDREIYRLAIDAWNKNKHRLKYNELPELLKTHKNRISFKDRFKVVAPDLKYSHSVMAHICKDGHYYIHPDPKQARSLTVREAARIQSFPDNYKFEGSRKSQFRQIGNAVPPMMAEYIASEIKKLLRAL